MSVSWEEISNKCPCKTKVNEKISGCDYDSAEKGKGYCQRSTCPLVKITIKKLNKSAKPLLRVKCDCEEPAGLVRNWETDKYELRGGCDKCNPKQMELIFEEF